MRRILKYLARLYPTKWRARYGVEYAALLEEREPRWQDLVDVVWTALKLQVRNWSFVGVVLPCALVGALLAVAISFSVSPRYVSQTVFAGESRFHDGVCGNQNDIPVGLQGPKPGVCADDATLNRYLGYSQQSAFSREFLASVIQKDNLYPRERARKPLATVIDQMQKSIHVKSLGQQEDRFRFAVQFDYREPRIAQNVNRELVRQLIEAGLKGFRFNASRTNFWIGTDLRASLPQAPAGLGRVQFGALGLFAGLLCGFTVAGILGARQIASKGPQ